MTIRREYENKFGLVPSYCMYEMGSLFLLVNNQKDLLSTSVVVVLVDFSFR